MSTVIFLMASSVMAGTDQCVAESNRDVRVNVYFDSAKNKVTGMEYIRNEEKTTFSSVVSKMLPYKEPKAANFTGYSMADDHISEMGVMVLHIFGESRDRASGTFTLNDGKRIEIFNLSCTHES